MSKTIEILKFLRVTPEKKRLIQVRGELFTSVGDIPDERVQKIIRQSIAEMVTMAGGYEKLVQDGFIKAVKVQPTLSDPEPRPLEEADLADLIEEDEENERESHPKVAPLPISPSLKPQSILTPQEPVGGSNINSSPESGSLLDRFRSLTGRKSEIPQSSVPHLDIAGQINQILQARFDRDQTLVGRQVDLRSTVKGDLQFIVDGRAYESVNDIQDEPIAQLFRNAIEEWESR